MKGRYIVESYKKFISEYTKAKSDYDKSKAETKRLWEVVQDSVVKYREEVIKLFNSLSLILTIWGLSSQSAFASHMAGSDMEFKCLGKDTYQIVLRVYRDCTGIPINATPQITLTPQAPCTQGTKSVTMTRTLVRPVRFMCAGMKNICEGGSFPFGMEENRFEVTVIFNNLLLS